MKTLSKIVVAAIVALFVAALSIVLDASDNFVLGVYFVVALSVSGLLGVFDIPEEKRNTIRKSEGARKDMRDAA